MESEKELHHRLNRIQGQIEGLKKRIGSQDPEDCAQTLQQLKAVTRALKKFGQAYVEVHIAHCLTENKNNPQAIEPQLIKAIDSAFNM